ncbi:MAG: hypothetical protein KF811_04275 [Dokdonella sp.]|nr:hypothetical protein [Dokdonella sp.]
MTNKTISAPAIMRRSKREAVQSTRQCIRLNRDDLSRIRRGEILGIPVTMEDGTHETVHLASFDLLEAMRVDDLRIAFRAGADHASFLARLGKGFDQGEAIALTDAEVENILTEYDLDEIRSLSVSPQLSDGSTQES